MIKNTLLGNNVTTILSRGSWNERLCGCPRSKHSFDTVNDTASIRLVINVIGSGHRGKESIRMNLYRLQSHPSPLAVNRDLPHTVRLVYIKLYIHTIV